MKYEMNCGLETHVELATETKIFCSCTTRFGGAPNTHCCPICTGQPGVLPFLNKKATEFAVRAGLAVGCKVNTVTHMDRKNYCYPDLPKAYQISQLDKPLSYGGFIELDSGKKIGITRIHIEEDAGKLVHERGNTFVDYNRGGVPLIEIVSEPDISSAAEAREYAEKLQLIMRYIGVSDCKMQEGSMRCDVNVSLCPAGSGKLGVRTEIKNMNSLSFMEKAIEYECERQAEILDEGGVIEQATLRFDEHTGETYVMRTKEDAQDYRYFPEPDILTVIIPEETVERIKSELPELPFDKMRRYTDELGINAKNARLMCRYKNLCLWFESALSYGASVKHSVNLITGVIFSFLSTEENKEKFDLNLTAAEFAKLVKYLDEGKITVSVAQSALLQMLQSGKCVNEFITEDVLLGTSDGELEKICQDAIAANPQAVADYVGGKEKAIFALYGFIKRATQGKADMNKVNNILSELLNK